MIYSCLGADNLGRQLPPCVHTKYRIQIQEWKCCYCGPLESPCPLSCQKKRTPNARRPCTCKVFPMMHKRKRTCADSDGGEPYVVIKHLDRVVQRRESRYALLSIDTNYRTLQPLRFFFLPPPVGNADGFPLDEVAVPTRRSSCSLCSSPTAIVTAMSKISSTPSCSLLLHSM
jgi:hypothetical protein